MSAAPRAWEIWNLCAKLHILCLWWRPSGLPRWHFRKYLLVAWLMGRPVPYPHWKPLAKHRFLGIPQVIPADG